VHKIQERQSRPLQLTIKSDINISDFVVDWYSCLFSS